MPWWVATWGPPLVWRVRGGVAGLDVQQKSGVVEKAVSGAGVQEDGVGRERVVCQERQVMVHQVLVVARRLRGRGSQRRFGFVISVRGAVGWGPAAGVG